MTDHHPPTSPNRGSAPTARQQRYVRSLAMQRGVSFTGPRTRAEASQLIDELRRRPADTAADRRREVRAVQDAMATGGGDAAGVREELEVTGYGASATWKRPLMSAGAGERVELGRYTISAGERVIYGQRVLGVVRVVDIPAVGRGRRYVIERGLTWMAELEAIVADYLQQAAVWDAVPAEPVCLLEITGAPR